MPETVMAGIAERAGGTQANPASNGDHAEIAASVTGEHGTVFVKAAFSDAGVASLRYELLAGRALSQPYSPAVEWDFETAGWLVVGFEHCAGPHADLSPGSPDLDLLSVALKDLGETPAPGHVSWLSPAARLGFTLPAMDGEMLVHTDLNPANLTVTPQDLRIVDWAFASKAAPWVELAMLAPWLIGSGHTPEQAEEWLARHSAWSVIDPEVLDEFASRNASKWSRKAGQGTVRWMHDLAVWTRLWSVYRRKKALQQRRTATQTLPERGRPPAAIRSPADARAVPQQGGTTGAVPDGRSGDVGHGVQDPRPGSYQNQLSHDELADAIRRFEGGTSVNKIARAMGWSDTTILAALRGAGYDVADSSSRTIGHSRADRPPLDRRSHDELAEAIHLFTLGTSVKYIAEALRRSVPTIRDALYEAGFDPGAHRRRVSHDELVTAKQLFESGQPVAQIAKALGRYSSTIHYAMRRAGLDIPVTRRPEPQQRAETEAMMVRLHHEGLSIRAIAVATGRSYGTVHRVLSTLEVPMRQRGSSRPRPAALSPARQKVLDAIAAGHTNPKDIMTATGYGHSRTYRLIDELAKHGQITKARHGRHITLAPAT